MPNTIRKVSYAYVTAASKPGEAARILQALRDANVNVLAFSGFPQGRNKAQIDVVTDDLDALKGVARGRKWRLSRIKRAFLVQGTDEARTAGPHRPGGVGVIGGVGGGEALSPRVGGGEDAYFFLKVIGVFWWAQPRVEKRGFWAGPPPTPPLAPALLVAPAYSMNG